MHWSATLALHSKPSSYGSFSSSSSTTLSSRSSSGTTIHIPQSIPEHQCVVQFTSPRIHRKEMVELMVRMAVPSTNPNTKSTVNGTSTMTVTETRTETSTFKMLLTSASSRWNGNGHLTEERQPLLVKEESLHMTKEELIHTASSYWIQERERMRIKQDRRHGTTQEIQLTGWRMAVVISSVPVLLLIGLLLYTLIIGTDNTHTTPRHVHKTSQPPTIDNAMHSLRLRRSSNIPTTLSFV